MNKTEQSKIVSGILMKLCSPLFEEKGREYTQGAADVNANFKRGAETVGLHPLQVWGIFYLKHHNSIMTYVKDVAAGKDPSTTEPIATRIADVINYSLLLAGLIVDLKLSEGTRLLELIKKEATDVNT